MHHIVEERFLHERGLTNYWGYSSIGYLAPHAGYAATGAQGEQIKEFKGMVKALHRAGIEVILDVVYNHTAEGNHLGPMLSFKGIDNASYYRLMPDDPARYMDFTGTGNSLNPVHPSVLRLIMDSLRYWVIDCHVDGFRFDLASALARELYDVDRLSAFFDVIHQDPVLSQVKLIAEPWDLGPGGYQVGNFPVLWTEWNGLYRDTMRDVWRGQANVAAFASRFTGSSDLYESDGRHPSASINFITAHDGFTLADLVSYNQKHNEANLEDNRDGTDDNRSWNCGVEGPTDDPEITRAARAPAAQLPGHAAALPGRADAARPATRSAARSAATTTPGARTTRSRGSTGSSTAQSEDLLEFTRRLLALRREHPIFHRTQFLNGKGSPSGLPDAWWFRPDGRRMTAADWQNAGAHALGVFLNGRGDRQRRATQGEPVVDSSFVLLLNAHYEDVTFTLPPRRFGPRWQVELSTAHPRAPDDAADGARRRASSRRARSCCCGSRTRPSADVEAAVDVQDVAADVAGAAPRRGTRRRPRRPRCVPARPAGIVLTISSNDRARRVHDVERVVDQAGRDRVDRDARGLRTPW